MHNEVKKIVFMGTPDFAVASLERIVEAGFNITAVVTAPDKPAGRGMQLTESAVKRYAVSKGLKVLQPVKLKSDEFINELRSLKADIQVVVAFRILPEVVWSMPPMGTINLHGSLLPQYRGAAPINWALINGETVTGVTTFKLKHEIDTGNILLQEKINIGEDETAGELHDRMKEVGGNLIVKTLKGLFDGNLEEVSQENTQSATEPTLLKYAPKLFTDNYKIDWHKNVDEIYNLIRGLSPYPGAFTILKDKTLKIYKADKVYTSPSVAFGEYETDGKSYLKFSCEGGYISLKELQLEGKKRMSVEQFLRGWRAGGKVK